MYTRPRAAVFLAAIVVFAALRASGQETVRFEDSFSGNLDGWSLAGGEWYIESGVMHADFRPYCDNNRDWCPEGDFLLADIHQPRTADWRMEVDFKYKSNSSPDGAANYQGPKAIFLLWSTYRVKETYAVGSDSWSETSVTLEARKFGPWNAIATTTVPMNWENSSFNRATLEKQGNVFSLYLNGQLVGTVAASTLPGSPKLGLHVTGSCTFDNFKLTEIGAPVTYSISGTIRNTGGQAKPGVTVTSSPGGAAATTDAAGNYTIAGLQDRTTYTLTPAYASDLGTWTFSQPVHIKTLSGANMSGVNFTAVAPGMEVETVRFTDDFSGTLGAWVNLGGWSIQGGRLYGYYGVGCGSMPCPHTYILLADQYQPRTPDWRMEADFTYVYGAYDIFYDATVNFARWSSGSAAESYYIGWQGHGWNGAPQSFVRWMQQTYSPAWLVAYFSDPATPVWDPKQWNRGKLEKRGDLYFFYLNDHLLGIGTGSVLTGNPKLGFHIYGTTLLDNFKLTELSVAAGTITEPQADLSVTQTASASSVVAGSAVTFTLSVSNLGPDSASDVHVTDTLPAGVSLVHASGSGWNCGVASNVVTCTRSSLGVGTAPPIAITVIVAAGNAGTSLTNAAEVASATEDPVSDNNDGNAAVHLLASEALPALDARALALLIVALGAIAYIALARQV